MEYSLRHSFFLEKGFVLLWCSNLVEPSFWQVFPCGAFVWVVFCYSIAKHSTGSSFAYLQNFWCVYVCTRSFDILFRIVMGRHAFGVCRGTIYDVYLVLLALHAAVDMYSGIPKFNVQRVLELYSAYGCVDHLKKGIWGLFCSNCLP